MALKGARISQLTPGTPPYSGSSLIELSVTDVNAPTGFDTRSAKLSDLIASVGVMLPDGSNSTNAAWGNILTKAGANSNLTITNGMLAGSITAAKLVGTDIATVGALTAGSIATGFGTITTANDITGGSLNTAGFAAITGTTLPTQAAGTLGLGGIASNPTTAANGEGDIFLSTTHGLSFQGKGSTSDISFYDSAGLLIFSNTAGTRITSFANVINVPSVLQNLAINVPVTGGTVTVATTGRTQILNPAGTLATLTVVLPPLPTNAQLTGIGTTQTITSLTVNAGTGGAAIVGAPSTMAANTAFQMVYVGANNAWYISA